MTDEKAHIKQCECCNGQGKRIHKNITIPCRRCNATGEIIRKIIKAQDLFREITKERAALISEWFFCPNDYCLKKWQVLDDSDIEDNEFDHILVQCTCSTLMEIEASWVTNLHLYAEEVKL